MKIQTIYKKYAASPFLFIALACFLLADITYFHSSKQTIVKKVQTKQIIITQSPQQKPQKTEQNILGITQVPTTIPTFVPPTNTPAPQATNTPIPQPTNTPVPATTVTIQISEPDGIFNFSVNFNGNTNPCSILNNAKDEGKIRSLTIDHYGAPLNSDYVKELNGYNNNWTFKINGDQKPTGCSNYNLNNGDTVEWKYN